MKGYLPIIILIASLSSLSAQTIKGKIFDPVTNDYLSGATVTITGKISITTSTDQSGEFRFNDAPSGRFILRINLIGYQSYHKELESKGQDMVLEIPLQNSVNQLPEIQIVSASRRPSSSQTLPYALSVLNQPSQSANIPRSTPEALNIVPGVFVQKTNHGGGSPFIRGLTGNQTLILIDGIRMNNSTFRYGPNQYLNTIDPSSVLKIEVLKGSGSVQYGSDALGGVIQVFTKEQSFSKESQFSGALSARYGSGNMEKSGSGEFGFSSPKFNITGIMSLKNFGDLVGGDTTGRQSPSGYTEGDTHLKAKWKLSESTELTIANQFVQQNSVDVYHKISLENFMINEMGLQTRNLSYLKLKIENSSPLFEQLNIIVSLNATQEERNTQKNASVILSREMDKVWTSNLSSELFSILTKNWTANSGVEFYQDRIRSKRINMNGKDGSMQKLRGLYPDNSSYINASAFTIHHLRLGSFNIEAGGRYNWVKTSLKDNDIGEINVSPQAFVLNAAVNYTHKRHNFYSSLNSGYRAPNIDDVGSLGIVDFRYELPSYGLKPEKGYNSEVGYKFMNERWNLGGAVYYNRLKNLITRVRTGQEIGGYKVYRKENTEKAIIKGIEAFIAGNINKKVFFESFVSFNHGVNLTKSEPMRRMPPFNGYTSFRYDLNKFYLKGEMLWADDQQRLAAGDRDDNRIPIGGTPGWQAFNMYCGYNFNLIQLRLNLNNLLNSDYRTHGSGINSVGRSIFLNMQYNF